MKRSLLGKMGIWSGASILVIIAAIALVFFTARQLGSQWDGYKSEGAKRIQLVSEIWSSFGYGGGIHHFKNYVIRGDAPRVGKFNKAYQRTVTAVEEYRKIPNITEKEIEALKGISTTFAKYAEAIQLARKLHGQGKSIQEIDKAIKIDDGPAMQAIAQLESAYRGVTAAHTDRVESAIFRINLFLAGLLGAVLLIAVGFVFFVRIKFVRTINNIIANLSTSSAQLTDASNQVAGSSQNLAEGASQQAASLEEISATLEQMASATQQNAENTKQADQLAGENRNRSEKGRSAMTRMSEAISQIKESSNQTAKIIKTIDEIAFQTNLLALNAAVEAARAGDAGKGFAVVAEEVRNLAQRSAEAAKSTSELIEESQARADLGVAAATEAQDILNEITEAAGQVGALLVEINASSTEQAKGTDQVNSAVTQMDGVTQSNAASAEQNAASSQQLSSQAIHVAEAVGELQQLVGGGKRRVANELPGEKGKALAATFDHNQAVGGKGHGSGQTPGGISLRDRILSTEGSGSAAGGQRMEGFEEKDFQDI